MAITSEIIGKLGGGGVDTRDVSVSDVGGAGQAHFLTHIDVPDGKQFVVSLIGSFSKTLSGAWAPEFQIGNIKVATTGSVGVYDSISAILTAPGDVNIITKSGTSVSFSGHVYTAEM